MNCNVLLPSKNCTIKIFKLKSFSYASLLIFFFLSMMPRQSLGQGNPDSITKKPGMFFEFNHLTVKDGLASNFINCLWQDAKGFLWIGTENGLQRYDGYRFEFNMGNGWESFQQLAIHQILSDKEGKVWVRSGNRVGIFDINSGNLSVVPIHTINRAASIVLNKDAEGNVFVLADMVNWYYFNKKSSSFEIKTFPFSIPFEWKVTAVQQDLQRQCYWISSNEKGLAMYDMRTKKIYTAENNPINHPLLKEKKLSKYVTNFFIDRQGRYWITAWDMWPGGKNIQNFYCYNEKSGSFTKDTTGIVKSAIEGGKYYDFKYFNDFGDRGMAAYGLNVLSVNSGKGFQSLITRTFDDYYFKYGIQANNVHQVFEDREHTLWVASDNGLYTIPVTPPQSGHIAMNDAQILSVTQGPSSTTWIGTWKSGILAIDLSVNQFKSLDIYNHAPADDNYKIVWAMHQQQTSSKIWIGCQIGRMIIYDTLNHRSYFLRPSVFENKSIRTIAEDKYHNLWFTSQSGAVVKWNGSFTGKDSGFQKVFQINNIAHKSIIDSHGWLWICTDSRGIYVIDTESGKLIKTFTAESDPAFRIQRNKVDDVLQYNDSIYYIGADILQQINIKARTVTPVFTSNGSLVGGIKAVIADKRGDLWLSTLNGIFKFLVPRKAAIQYGQSDGLISVENASTILDMAYRCKNNNIILAGNDHLLYFNPDQYHNDLVPQDVTITDFSLNGQFLMVDSLLKEKTLNFNYKQNSFTIDFASLSFREANKLIYYYMLEGAEKDWQVGRSNFQAVYNLLPPGSYTFLVKAQNEAGTFSKNTTQIHFVIHPPFWQTYWFIALEVLVCAIVIYYLYRMRINRLLHVERVRSRLARDLHDDMGSTLSTINILSNMAMKKLDKDTVATREYITRISNNSSRIMEAMDDIVWSINPLNDTMPKVIARMKEFSGSVLESKDIEYIFIVEDYVKDIGFDMESKRELYLIFKETINNLVKYSASTKVIVTMSHRKKYFSLKVEDNGVGFNLEDPELQSTQRGNGLRNMQKRAEHINGKLMITSAPGQGTTVELLIPIA